MNAGPQPTFRFRYPIVREVVYEGLLERHRRHLHFLAAAQAGQGAASSSALQRTRWPRIWS